MAARPGAPAGLYKLADDSIVPYPPLELLNSMAREDYVGASPRRAQWLSARSGVRPHPTRHRRDAAADLAGPTEESNWAIPGVVLVGAFPAAIDDAVTDRILSSILLLGVDTFVCLQSEYQHHGVAEHEWRAGQKLRCAPRLASRSTCSAPCKPCVTAPPIPPRRHGGGIACAARPYIFDALRLLRKQEMWDGWLFPPPQALDFVHFPIVDCTASASDASLLELAAALVDKVAQGQRLYVHCWCVVVDRATVGWGARRVLHAILLLRRKCAYNGSW